MSSSTQKRKKKKKKKNSSGWPRETLQRFISKENKLLVFLKTIRTWRVAKLVVGNRVNWS